MVGWCNGNTLTQQSESLGGFDSPYPPYQDFCAREENMVSYYKQHSKNLWMIKKAIKSIQMILRDYISRDEELNIYVFTKILSHLVDSWAEVRVLKLIYEKGGFNESERNRIIRCSSPKERWEMALTIAFCKAYKIPNAEKINSVTTPITPRTRYQELLKLLDNDLLESNQLRNRIAHGQWKYAFTNDLSGISEQLTGMLRQENIVKLQLRLKMFTSLAQVIHDLAVSKSTFERDFDSHFRKIEEQKRNFHKRDYEDYRRKMISKRERGVRKRFRS